MGSKFSKWDDCVPYVRFLHWWKMYIYSLFLARYLMLCLLQLQGFVGYSLCFFVAWRIRFNILVVILLLLQKRNLFSWLNFRWIPNFIHLGSSNVQAGGWQWIKTICSGRDAQFTAYEGRMRTILATADGAIDCVTVHTSSIYRRTMRIKCGYHRW